MRIVEAEVAEHQEDRDGNGNRRHHPRRQDEEQQIVLERHPEPAEGIGRRRTKDHAKRRGPKADDDRVQEPLAIP